MRQPCNEVRFNRLSRVRVVCAYRAVSAIRITRHEEGGAIQREADGEIQSRD